MELSGNIMIVRQFLHCARTASAKERAEGISVLAIAHLYSKMSAEDHADAEIVLTAFLDDPSPLVRRALAEALADAHNAPRPLVLALASEGAEISAPLLKRSPVLTDHDVLHLLAEGDASVLTEIAQRPHLSDALCSALAQKANFAVALALVQNTSANLNDASARLLLKRFHQSDIREAFLNRPGLSAELRYSLMQSATRALSSYLATNGWINPVKLERLTSETEQEIIIQLASEKKGEDLQAFVLHLCETGAIRPKLLLCSLFTGSLDLFQTALALLTNESLTRIIALTHEPESSGFAALYNRAKLPSVFLNTFRSVLNLRLSLRTELPTPEQVRMMIAKLINIFNRQDQMPTGLLNFLNRIDANAAKSMAQTLCATLSLERSSCVEGLREMPVQESEKAANVSESQKIHSQSAPILAQSPNSAIQDQTPAKTTLDARVQAIREAKTVAHKPSSPNQALKDDAPKLEAPILPADDAASLPTHARTPETSIPEQPASPPPDLSAESRAKAQEYQAEQAGGKTGDSSGSRDMTYPPVLTIPEYEAYVHALPAQNNTSYFIREYEIYASALPVKYLQDRNIPTQPMTYPASLSSNQPVDEGASNRLNTPQPDLKQERITPDADMAGEVRPKAKAYPETAGRDVALPHVIDEFELFAIELTELESSPKDPSPAGDSNIYKINFGKPRAA